MSFSRIRIKNVSTLSGSSLATGAFGAPVVAGDFIIASFAWTGAVTITGISDGIAGQAPYILMSGPTVNGTSGCTEVIYICINSKAGTPNITATMSGAASNGAAFGTEYRCSLGGAVTVRNQAPFTGSGAVGHLVGAGVFASGAVVAQKGDLQFGFGFSFGQITSQGAGYTSIDNQTFWASEEILASAGGSVTATWNGSGTGDWNSNVLVVGPPTNAAFFGVEA